MMRRLRSAAALLGLLVSFSATAEIVTYELRGYIATSKNTEGPYQAGPVEVSSGNFRVVVALDLTAPYGSPDAGGGVFDAVRSFGYWTDDGPGGAYAQHVQYDRSTGVSAVFVDEQLINGDPTRERESARVTVVTPSNSGTEWKFELKAALDSQNLLSTEYEMPDLTVFPADSFQLKIAAQDGSGHVAIGRVTSVHRFYPQDQLATYIESFDGENALRPWRFTGGSWSATAGTLRSLDNVALSIALHDRPLQKDDFTYSVRVRSGWGASGNTLGAIYNYVDDRNYYSVQLSPVGVAKLNRVVNGVSEMVATTSYTGAGAKLWVSLNIRKSAGRTTVLINGAPAFSQVLQQELKRGKVGVFTRWNPSQFDDVYLNQGFIEHELFSLLQPTATIVSGTWSFPAVEPGIIRATSNQSSAVLLTNQVLKREYQHSALIYSPWSASGNTAGLVYDYVDDRNYKEVRLSPNGNATLYRVANNVRTTVLVASGPPASKQWINISVARFDGFTTVSIDGELRAMVKQPLVDATRAGVVSAWNLASFAEINTAQRVSQ